MWSLLANAIAVCSGNRIGKTNVIPAYEINFKKHSVSGHIRTIMLANRTLASIERIEHNEKNESKNFLWFLLPLYLYGSTGTKCKECSG